MSSKVDARLLKSTKFPPEFNQKVDMQKVNLHVMKKWIAKRILEILGNEDDVLIELCYNLIEGSRYPDIKSLQIQLTGFLDKDTASFCKELWNLLLSGQNSPQGVPKELLEAKKLELMQEKMDADRASARRDRESQDFKERENRDRRQAADSWRGRGRRGDRAFDSRGRGGYGRAQQQRPPSPELRGRGSRDLYGCDSYVPLPRRGRGQVSRRGRGNSLSREASSRSRSRSPNTSGSSPRWTTSPRRTASPARDRVPRKRSRSSHAEHRPYRRGNDTRDRSSPRGRSRSSSAERGSPAPKRRRHSRPRNSSLERNRRRSPSYSRAKSRWDYRDVSRSRSRSRSRGRDDTPRDRRRISPVDTRRGRRCSTPPVDESDYESGHGHGRRQRRDHSPRGGGRWSRRGREESTSRRRNSSSEPLPSSIRGKSADVLEDEPRAAPPKPIASIEKNDEARKAVRNESLLKEKLLRERIMKTRCSTQGGDSAGGRGQPC